MRLNDQTREYMPLIISFYRACYDLKEWASKLEAPLFVIPQDGIDTEYRTMSRFAFIRMKDYKINNNTFQISEEEKSENVLYMISKFKEKEDYVEFKSERTVGKLIFHFKESNMSMNLYGALNTEFHYCMQFDIV